jgi:hypothetical protein
MRLKEPTIINFKILREQTEDCRSDTILYSIYQYVFLPVIFLYFFIFSFTLGGGKGKN